MKTLKILLLWVMLVGLGPYCQAGEPEPAPKPEAKRVYPPPGDLIDIGGGRKMHCLVKGSGPIIVCGSCLGEASYDWMTMQDQLSQFATVVCYDRAGLGWSDPGPLPRTFVTAVADLHLLLKNHKKLDPPYLLVGNSYGGVVARLYASTYPREVAGLVLLDAGYMDDFADDVDPKTMGSFGPAAEAAYALRHFISFRPVFKSLCSRGNGDGGQELAEMRLALKSRVSEVEALFAERAGLVHFREANEKMRRLEIPVTVVTSTSFGKDRGFGWWDSSQKRLSETVSGDVVWRKENVAHLMHHDKPDLVIEVVKETLERIAAKEKVRSHR